MADIEKSTHEVVREEGPASIAGSNADADSNGDTSSGGETLFGGTSQDARDMYRMGKIQELKRNFRTISTLGFTCCVMGTWEILYLQNTQALIDGDKAGMFWSMIWCYVGQSFVVLSLAEMASMAPTAGGQYHWVSEFAPPRLQRVLSYTSGWMSMLAWQLFVTADTALTANLVLALVSTQNADFVIRPFMNTVLMIAVVAVVALLNIFAVRWFPKFENAFAVLHIACFCVIVGILWGYGERGNGSEIFFDFKDNNAPGTTWPAIGVTLLVGQVPGLFTIQGPDSAAHIGEEVRRAGTVVPRAMLVAFFANVPLTLGLLVTYIYTLGDTAAAVASPTGFPFIYALQQGLPSANAVTGVVFIMFLLMFMISVSTAMSTTRQTFAFARDNGTPLAAWLGRVDTARRVPVNAVLATAAFTAALSLINLGSPVAFNAFISASVVALMSTYTVSIGCVLARRLGLGVGDSTPYPGRARLPPSPFSLGRFGVPVNALGLAFCLEGFFWGFWPIANSAAPEAFNWAVVIFAAIAAAALAQFVLVARYSYAGPVAKVRRAED